MNFFSKYSLIANIFSIMSVVTVILFISAKAFEGYSPKQDEPLAEKVEVQAYDFYYNTYDEKGNIIVSLHTDYLEQYVNNNAKFETIKAKSFDEDGFQTWQVKAPHAKYIDSDPEKKSVVRLYGGVKSIMFTKEESEKNKDDDLPKNIHIDSEEVFYSPDTKDFYNNKFVKIYDPKTANNTTGIGIKGNSDSEVVKLTRDVRSYYDAK